MVSGRIVIQLADPRQDAEGIGFALHVVGHVTGSDGDVVVVVPGREHEADLVIGRGVVDQSAEAAIAVLGVMQ